MEDPTLTERLYKSRSKILQRDRSTAVTDSQLPADRNPAPGDLYRTYQYLSRKLMNQMGGKNSIAFGMGKSNAKVYVPSTEGIRFSDVAGEEEAKENLQEIVDYLHNPEKYTRVGASMPKGVLLVVPPGTGKPCWQKQ